MNDKSRLAATVVVPTHKRPRELEHLLRSLCAQSVPLEIIVMDDGASDDVRRMVETEFTAVTYRSVARGKGPAFQRNRGVEFASHPIVFSFDDDTLLPDPGTVGATLAAFSNPRVGAVAIPYVNIRFENIVRQKAPNGQSDYVGHAFVGAAHAVRRDAFLAVGGFPEHFFYMGEEGDICLRLLATGYVTLFGTAPPVEHFESPIRDSRLAARYGSRNDVCFGWRNVPTLMLPLYFIANSLNRFRATVRSPEAIDHLTGYLEGCGAVITGRERRAAVSLTVFRLFRTLKRDGPLPLRTILPLLPPLNKHSASRLLEELRENHLPLWESEDERGK